MKTLSFNEVIAEFTQLAIEQGLEFVEEKTEEEVNGLLTDFGQKFILEPESYYLIGPRDFIDQAYFVLEKHPVLEITNQLLKNQPDDWSAYDSFSQLFFKIVGTYLIRCCIPNTIPPAMFKEKNNYFTKKAVPGQSIFSGKFIRTPSTFFGKKELQLFEIRLPSSNDLLLIYLKEGILLEVMKYKKRAFMNYTSEAAG